MSHLVQLALEGFGAPVTARCAICGRTLTDPDSVQRGVGPVCAGKHSATGSGEKNEAADSNIRCLSEPITDGFVFHLLPDGNLETNVPLLVRHHSPTGWSIGYSGSGPADLALNVLEATLRTLGCSDARTPVWDGNTVFALAWNLHQDFKQNFIASLEQTDALQRIPFSDVLAFIATHAEGNSDANE